jgi:internalin A
MWLMGKGIEICIYWDVCLYAPMDRTGWDKVLRRIEEVKRKGTTVLSLSSLGLREVPDLSDRFPEVTQLDLSDNPLAVFPDFLGELPNLYLLNMSRCKLTTAVGKAIWPPKLQRLGLAMDQLEAIPESLSEATKLTQLVLADNQIAEIPHWISGLRKLRTLNLAGNRIAEIPQALASLPELDRLYLHANLHLKIPDEVLGPKPGSGQKLKSAREILDYYFAQHAGARPLNEGKLILVGRGAVGKTSLVNALRTGKFDPREDTTQGIKITDWTCPIDEDKITLHIWDFGGQEMMHATHQFFLTARTLYLLVLNRRQGGYDEEADYWLRLIRAFGGKGAPVIVVLNKQKLEPFDVNRGGWLERYSDNIRDFVRTDCTDSKSIGELQQKIQEQLAGLKSVRDPFPDQWFAIKDELSQTKDEFLPFASYRAICSRHGENEIEKQNSLSGYLNDLGIALSYKNDPRLRFAYVLKPEWVTKGIYALLHAFVGAKGLFTVEEASDVLKPLGYTVEAVDFILGLMEQFELSFPLGDPQHRVLIPQLLYEQQSAETGSFQPAECLNFGYRYTILPEGLLPRFIVRTHHLSDGPSRWKSGVILRHATSGCRALVRAEAADRQVRVHVDGPLASRRDLLAVIRYNFDVIHLDYQFQPAELVFPEPSNPVTVSSLETLRKHGKTTVSVVLPDDRLIEPEIGGLMAAVETSTPQFKLFLSYAHEDVDALGELRKQLKVMERNGQIRSWADGELRAGEKWEPRLMQELHEADIVVCQLSPDFLNSDFCVEKELEIAMKRREAEEAELIAFVLRHCQWQQVGRLKEFQILPCEGKPLSKWADKDEYWLTIAEGIQGAIKRLEARGPRPEWRRLRGLA